MEDSMQSLGQLKHSALQVAPFSLVLLFLHFT